jgi:hypothetical protein
MATIGCASDLATPRVKRYPRSVDTLTVRSLLRRLLAYLPSAKPSLLQKGQHGDEASLTVLLDLVYTLR